MSATHMLPDDVVVAVAICSSALKIACRRCFRLRSHTQPIDRTGRALSAMTKIAKQIDPNVDMDLPDEPPDMHRSR